jgi:AAA ATPase domain
VHLSRICISGFRCFDEFTLGPDPTLNLIIGENNSGKTALLDALDQALGRSNPVFSVEDFYSQSSKSDAEPARPIIIDLEIKPGSPGAPAEPFSESFVADFADNLIAGAAGESQKLRLRTQATYETDSREVSVGYFTLRADDSPVGLSIRQRLRLRSYIPFYMVSAIRDTADQFGRERSYWGRFMASIDVGGATVASAEGRLAGISKDVFDDAPRLRELSTKLAAIGKVIRLSSKADAVLLDPVVLELEELLQGARVRVRPFFAPRPM